MEFEEVIEHARRFTGQSDFLHKMVIQYDHDPNKMTVNMVEATTRTVERFLAKEKLSKSPSRHYGEVGYYDIFHLRVLSRKLVNGEYGSAWAVDFEDIRNGNHFVEYSTKNKYEELVGKTITIYGKIKDHFEMSVMGSLIPATKLTFCEVIDVDG